MTLSSIQQKIKPWMLLIAMACGIFFHNFISMIEWIIPYLILTMLTITFCRISPREFRPGPMAWRLMAIQFGGCLVLYYALRPLAGEDVAQAAFICVLCPTATAAPVVTGMLGGNVARLTSFSVISNLGAAILAPLFFSMTGGHTNAGISFAGTSLAIGSRVAPLILLPLGIAFSFYFAAPKLHKAIGRMQPLSFYLWSVSLIVAVGRSVSFAMAEPADKIPEMALIAATAGVVCLAQFAIGRRIGGRFGDKISGAQGLGQKNTILAIWLALTFLNPISSIGPAAYVAWQNIINSAQIFRHSRQSAESPAAKP